MFRNVFVFFGIGDGVGEVKAITKTASAVKIKKFHFISPESFNGKKSLGYVIS